MPAFLKSAAVLVLFAAPAAAQEFRVRPVKHDTSSIATHAASPTSVKAPAAPATKPAVASVPKPATQLSAPVIKPAATVKPAATPAAKPTLKTAVVPVATPAEKHVVKAAVVPPAKPTSSGDAKAVSSHVAAASPQTTHEPHAAGGPAAEAVEHATNDVRQMGTATPVAPVTVPPRTVAPTSTLHDSTATKTQPAAPLPAAPLRDSTLAKPAPASAGVPAPARRDSSFSKATPAATAAPAKPVPPLALNLGTLLFTGNMQAFYVAGSSDVINTFKIRRVELKFIGTLSPTVKWTVMVDPAKALKVTNSVPNQSTTILQDAFITIKANRYDVTAGQFLIPLTFEGSGFSASVLETYDRSLMVTDGKFGQVRDMGAMLGGPLAFGAKFRVGLFNGVGDFQNTPDANGQKAIIGRIESPTPIPGLRLGMSGAYSGDSTADNTRHDRVGGDAEFAWDKLGLRGEIMKGWDGTDVKLGWYGLASWMLRDDVMLVTRYDTWDKDATATPKGVRTTERDLLVGTSWLLQGTNVQVRANYVFRYLNPAPQRDQVVVSLQAAW